MQSQSKSQQDFVVYPDKMILKFTWKNKESKRAKIISKKENQGRRLILPDFKAYYKTQ